MLRICPAGIVGAGDSRGCCACLPAPAFSHCSPSTCGLLSEPCTSSSSPPRALQPPTTSAGPSSFVFVDVPPQQYLPEGLLEYFVAMSWCASSWACTGSMEMICPTAATIPSSLGSSSFQDDYDLPRWRSSRQHAVHLAPSPDSHGSTCAMLRPEEMAQSAAAIRKRALCL